jgi:hypothetical protein
MLFQLRDETDANGGWAIPTPQSGVAVERRWKRGDYYVPGTAEDDRLVQI